MYNTELKLLHACNLFSQARTQISYRPITQYSADSLLFYLREGRRFDLSPLAVQWVTTLTSLVKVLPRQFRKDIYREQFNLE